MSLIATSVGFRERRRTAKATGQTHRVSESSHDSSPPPPFVPPIASLAPPLPFVVRACPFAKDLRPVTNAANGRCEGKGRRVQTYLECQCRASGRGRTTRGWMGGRALHSTPLRRGWLDAARGLLDSRGHATHGRSKSRCFGVTAKRNDDVCTRRRWARNINIQASVYISHRFVCRRTVWFVQTSAAKWCEFVRFFPFRCFFLPSGEQEPLIRLGE